ncbi:hypothetical protein Pvag_2754 [Pantoea vagans C9-1]|nr:hypothetical protein Pvag_2754 [Pantoea vagans C9-1]
MRRKMRKMMPLASQGGDVVRQPDCRAMVYGAVISRSDGKNRRSG